MTCLLTRAKNCGGRASSLVDVSSGGGLLAGRVSTVVATGVCYLQVNLVWWPRFSATVNQCQYECRELFNVRSYGNVVATGSPPLWL